MLSERELISHPAFWMETLQNELYRQLDAYREANNLNRKGLAEKLGYSKSYITRLLSGEFNHSAKKLIDLSLKIGKAPIFQFKDLNEYISEIERERVQLDLNCALTNSSAEMEMFQYPEAPGQVYVPTRQTPMDFSTTSNDWEEVRNTPTTVNRKQQEGKQAFPEYAIAA